jgi:multicomponent Na+:H+ antiporter subunit D
MSLVPLVVAVPFAAGTLIAIVGKWIPPRIADVAGIGAAAASTVLAAILVSRTAHRTLVYWFGGWRPKVGQFPVGISFTVDRFGAGLACFACALVTVALLYSWRYLEEEHGLFEVIALLFCAGMAGFALSGDLFNMFVFFELMGVAAYALTAYQVEEEPALQAAFNFAVSNTIGSFLVLLGLALVYGRTGSLNLAELGQRLGTRHDGLVVVAFTLLVCGFFVKAAIVPFHFWLADAHAAAPAPVCLLFSGVMVELGLYAVARIYWTVFALHGVRPVLLVLGAVTAVGGAYMCVMQRHLKRLLAYGTISEAGCMLIGTGLLSHDGTAGAALTVLAHGLAKGSLFLACGVLLVCLGEVDELELHGRGRELRVLGVTWLLGAIALASPPFAGTFTGHALIEDSGPGWVAPVLAFATIVSTGAILRAGARVFLGLGPRNDPLLSEEPRESPASRENPSVALMTALALALAIGGLVIGALPGFAVAVEDAAHVFVDRHAYLAAVLQHQPVVHEAPSHWVTTTSSVVWAVATLLGSCGWAVFGLYREQLPQPAKVAMAAVARPFRAVHSGHIGDYVTWLVFGVAVVGGVFALTAS